MDLQGNQRTGPGPAHGCQRMWMRMALGPLGTTCTFQTSLSWDEGHDYTSHTFHISYKFMFIIIIIIIIISISITITTTTTTTTSSTIFHQLDSSLLLALLLFYHLQPGATTLAHRATCLRSLKLPGPVLRWIGKEETSPIILSWGWPQCWWWWCWWWWWWWCWWGSQGIWSSVFGCLQVRAHVRAIKTHNFMNFQYAFSIT